MKYLKTWTVVCAAVVPFLVNARPPEPIREAAVKLTSRSIRLTPATGESSRSITFSTPVNPKFSGNGELRPSVLRAGTHESSYAVFDGEERVEIGTIYVQLPVADTNANGVADIFDLDAGVDTTVSGDMTPKGSTVGSPVSMHLVRAAGSEDGTFTITPEGAVTLGGGYSVLYGTGVLEYQRTDTGALLNFEFGEGITNSRAASRVLDSNTVKLPVVRVRFGPTKVVRLAPTVLERSGQVYQGIGQLTDGLLETTVKDFRSYVLQITDTNDRDGNSVPDFSDALPPYIAVQPARKIVPLGSDVVLSVVVEGTGPFTFEWQQNGHGLSNVSANPNERVLVIPAATLDDKGSYRVRVSNSVGSVWSESTSVSFMGQ